MTNKEAIMRLEALRALSSEHSLKTIGKAIDMAIDALSVKPTGDPLTLEQLREMGGQPAWIVPVGKEDWEPHWDVMKYKRFCANSKTQRGKLYFLYEDSYGTRWLAYAYPHAHIDREAWERCWTCRWVVSQPNWRSDYKFCPRCGKPLTEEAWDELEKRLRGCKE